MTELHPQIKWAQRKDKLYLTIQLRDIQKQKVQLESKSLKFTCISNQKIYAFTVDLYSQIIKQESKWTKTGFSLMLVLEKKQKNAEYWPRIRQEKKKQPYLQIDWQKWVDEDEEQQEGSKGLDGMQNYKMNNFNDSDDEEEEEPISDQK